MPAVKMSLYPQTEVPNQGSHLPSGSQRCTVRDGKALAQECPELSASSGQHPNIPGHKQPPYRHPNIPWPQAPPSSPCNSGLTFPSATSTPSSRHR